MTPDLLTYVAARRAEKSRAPDLRALYLQAERSKVVIRDCTLYNADCSAILPLLHDVDAVVTDPPYGIDIAGRETVGSGTKAIPAKRFAVSDWDKRPISAELMNLVRSRAPLQIIFGGNYYALPPTSCWLIWDKLNSGAFADCELAWTNLPMAVRRIQYRWSGYVRQNNEPRGDHPTQKPVGVMSWCIGHLPDDAQTILDPFMGSGTTGVAAVRMGRKFVGIERDKTFFEVACRRIHEAYAQPRLEAVEKLRVEQKALF
jgi:site-specific DNA-methyltransferase (adenine-specific)/modification methylase